MGQPPRVRIGHTEFGVLDLDGTTKELELSFRAVDVRDRAVDGTSGVAAEVVDLARAYRAEEQMPTRERRPDRAYPR
jgi:hypothetical protein